MNNELQRQAQESRAIQITSATWQSAFARLPVKATQLPAEVLRLDTPAISALNRGSGSTALGETIFEGVLYSVMKFYGAPCNELVMVELGQMAHARFHYLHLAELKHFALLAKEGKFNLKESFKRRDLDGYFASDEEWDGKMYGPLTPALLLKWLDRYAADSLANRALTFGESRPTPMEPNPDVKYVDPALVEAAMNWKDLLLATTEETRQEKERIEANQAEYRRLRREASQKVKNHWLEQFGENVEADRVGQPQSSADTVELELAIMDFADRVAAGKPTNSLADLQFYRNNRDAIEAELASRME